MLTRVTTGLAFALTAVVLGAGAASAADLPARMYTKAPPPMAVSDWTGFYIGANVGYGSARYDSSLGALALATSQTGSGILGGGQLGYNQQFGRWVLGLEVDGQGTDQSGNFSLFVPGVGGGTITQSNSMPWFFTGRARLGYTIAPTWLIYATGGAAVADVKSNVFATGFGSATTETTRAGWTAGAGVEVMFARNWSAKAEYLHLDIGSNTSTVFGVVPTSIKLTDDIGRFGVNYHF
jgi:outer membrane immunogenic protein